MAKPHIEMHAIADLVRKWDQTDTNTAILIAKRLHARLQPDEEKLSVSFPFGERVGADVQAFNAGLRNWIEHLLAIRGYVDLNADSIISGWVPSDFDPNRLLSLFVVIVSIVENIASRATITKHKLCFESEGNAYPSVRCLQITWESDSPMRPEIDRDSILLQPLADEHGRPHFGFFLIGVHTRQQGGTAEFADLYGQRGERCGFKVAVRMPYDASINNDAKTVRGDNEQGMGELRHIGR